MSNCINCNKPNNYQDEPYLCWECKDRGVIFSPRKLINKTLTRDFNIRWTANEWELNWCYYNNLGISCKNCGKGAGQHASWFTSNIAACPGPTIGNYHENFWYQPIRISINLAVSPETKPSIRFEAVSGKKWTELTGAFIKVWRPDTEVWSCTMQVIGARLACNQGVESWELEYRDGNSSSTCFINIMPGDSVRVCFPHGGDK